MRVSLHTQCFQQHRILSGGILSDRLLRCHRTFTLKKNINAILSPTFIRRYPAMMFRIKCFFVLLLLMIADTAPVPVVGSICMYILLARPPWFKELVDRIYGG